MKAISKEQVCFKCKERKCSNDFYEKGNRFINCSKCRRARGGRKRSLEVLLNKENKTSQYA